MANDCGNTRPCPCWSETCPNKGRCCACVANHRARGNLPVCLRPAREQIPPQKRKPEGAKE